MNHPERADLPPCSVSLAWWPQDTALVAELAAVADEVRAAGLRAAGLQAAGLRAAGLRDGVTRRHPALRDGRLRYGFLGRDLALDQAGAA